MVGSYGIIDEALEHFSQGKMSFRDAVTILSNRPREDFIFKGLDKLGIKSLSEKLKTAHMARRETIKKLQQKFSLEGCFKVLSDKIFS